MRENCTYGSMRGSRRKTAKSVLRVVEDRAGVPDNKGRSALLYTLLNSFNYDPKNAIRVDVAGTIYEMPPYETKFIESVVGSQIGDKTK